MVITAIDLRRGATPDWTHGLAAVYLGFSVAFGPRMIDWSDQRFAHRFAGGPPPTKPPASPSWARVSHEWREWGRMVVAGGIASALLLVMIWYVGDAARTQELWGWMYRMGLVTTVWLVGWPVWESIKVATSGPPAGSGGRSG